MDNPGSKDHLAGNRTAREQRRRETIRPLAAAEWELIVPRPGRMGHESGVSGKFSSRVQFRFATGRGEPSPAVKDKTSRLVVSGFVRICPDLGLRWTRSPVPALEPER